MRGTPHFSPQVEDPDPPEYWDDERWEEYSRRLDKYYGRTGDAWEEEKHPRAPAGTPSGGQFTSGGGGGGATATPRVTLKQEQSFYEDIEDAPTNEGIEAAEDNWRGGVADFGDPQAAIDVQSMEGYFDYRSHLEEAARKNLGEEFPVYRLMQASQLEDWKNGADMDPAATTLNPEFAKKFTNFAAFDETRGGERVVVKIPATPASIVMRGSREESEIVLNPNEISGDMVEIVASRAPKPLVTKTAAFKEWFGNSKVVDKNGEPLVVYHGTDRSFTQFTTENAPYRGGILAFFSTSKTFAKGYGKKVEPVYLKIENPFDFRKDWGDAYDFWSETGGISDDHEANRILMGLGKAEEMTKGPGAAGLSKSDFVNLVKKGSWDALENEEFVEWLRGRGHDGIVTLENKAVNYAIFEPTQVKSATKNVGTFDPDEGDILKKADPDEPIDLNEIGIALPKGHVERIHRIAKQTAVEHGVDPDTVHVNLETKFYNMQGTPTVPGSEYAAQGTCNLRDMQVNIYPENIFLDGVFGDHTAYIKGIVVHELGHVKLETVRDAIREEHMATKDFPGMPRPLNDRFAKHNTSRAIIARRKGDGITKYSKLYWDEFEKKTAANERAMIFKYDGARYLTAQHETIAEMMRVKGATGELKGTRAWTSYYNDVMKTWDELQAKKKL